jgi:hypothetical protein
MLPKHPWLQKSIEHLKKLPQIKSIATNEPYFDHGLLADGKLTLIINDNQQINYIFVIKNSLNVNTLDSTLEYFYYFKQLVTNNHHCLLITNNLPKFIVEQFLENRIEFLDTNGTIYLNNQNLYILVRNNINIDSKRKFNKKKITKETLLLTFLFVKEPKFLEKIYNTKLLAKLAGIRFQYISQNIEILINLGYLEKLGNGEYIITDYLKLLERWEIGYIETLRPSLFIETYRTLKPENFIDTSSKLIEIVKNNNILIGGELGASILTNNLRPISAVLHLPENQNYRELMVKLRLVPDPEGNITFLRTFGKENGYLLRENDLLIADPLLIHAELMMIPDDRIKEIAQQIYYQYIKQYAN